MAYRETQDQELTDIVDDMNRIQSPGTAETQKLNNESSGEANKIESSSSPENNVSDQEQTTEKTCCALSDKSYWEPFFTPTPLTKCKVTILDLCLLIFSALTYLADIGTDIWLAVRHYQNGDMAWMALTIAFVLVPSLIGIITIISNGCVDKSQWLELIVSLPGCLIICMVQDIHNAYKSMNMEHYPNDLVESIATTLEHRLREAYGEATPELILQLYVILTDTRTIDLIQWISLIISLVSLSWSMVSSYKANYMEYREIKIPHLGVVLCLGWHICTVWARVVAFAICAIYSIKLFISILGIHFVISFIYFKFIHRVKRLMNSFVDGIVDSLMSLISSFTMSVFKISRRKYLFLHVLIYLENVGMLMFWLYSPESDDVPVWFRYSASFSILAVYLIGVFLQIVYYVYLHPKNFKKDKKKRIQVYIPLDEWLQKTTCPEN